MDDVTFMSNQPQSNDQPNVDVQEEFGLLMSLALDGLLDDNEQNRFQSHLDQYPSLARQWRSWQMLDRHLTLTPAVEPKMGFLHRFETRLEQQERQRFVWRNLLFATFIILIWGGLFVGTVGLGAYVLLYQSDWLGTFVHTVAFYFDMISRWFATVRDALISLVATPQAIGFGLAYLCASIALLIIWVRFLRQSTQVNEPELVFDDLAISN